MTENKRNIQMHFVVSPKESALIRERMDSVGVRNMAAYLRKMAIDGYIVHLNLSEVQELTSLLRHCSNNINQYARKAHETGNIYHADIEDIRTRLDGLWEVAGKIIAGLSEVL